MGKFTKDGGFMSSKSKNYLAKEMRILQKMGEFAVLVEI